MRSIKFNDFGAGFHDVLTNTNICFSQTLSQILMVNMECEGILLSINTLKNAVVFVISITMHAVFLFSLFVVDIYTCQI